VKIDGLIDVTHALERLGAQVDQADPVGIPLLTAAANALAALAAHLNKKSRTTSSDEAHRLLTAAEAAERCQVPVSWIRRHSKELPRRKIGHHVRYPESELMAYFRRRSRYSEPYIPRLPPHCRSQHGPCWHSRTGRHDDERAQDPKRLRPLPHRKRPRPQRGRSPSRSLRLAENGHNLGTIAPVGAVTRPPRAS